MAPHHTILVVDDDVVQRINAEDVLTGAGYIVLDACDADAALKVLEERDDISLIFTDFQMPPGADGIALAGHISMYSSHLAGSAW